MDWLQQFSTVAAVLMVLAAILWMLQRRGLARFAGLGLKPRAERKLQIIERLQLTPQHSICLVRVEGRTMLIGTAPSSCHRMEEGPL